MHVAHARFVPGQSCPAAIVSASGCPAATAALARSAAIAGNVENAGSSLVVIAPAGFTSAEGARCAHITYSPAAIVSASSSRAAIVRLIMHVGAAEDVLSVGVFV